MTLIIEDGNGLVDSNSYASVSDLRQYADLRSATLPDEDSDCEVLLIKAMDFLYDQNYQGYKTKQTQSLPWPRYEVCIEGWPIPATEIPRQLIYCQCALAIEATNADLLPTQGVQDPGQVLQETVGPITTVYANNGIVRRVPAMAKVEPLLRVLIKRNGLIAIRT